MFDSITPTQPQGTMREQEPQQPAQQTVSRGIGDPERARSVYTMPAEYLPKAPVTPIANGGMHWKWVIAIVVVVLLVVGGAAAAIIVVLQQSDAEAPSAFPLPANGTTNTTNTPINGLGGTALNVTVNGNLANNINGSLFPNSNGATNSATNQSGVRAFINRTVVPLASDKDRDQLTDAEEVLYGSKVSLPDTDSDGFVDGSEVLKGFSPLSPQKTMLQEGLVLKYENAAYGWKMDYPTKWIAGATDDAQRTVLFTSDAVEGEFVQISIIDNPSGRAAKDWYLSLFADADPETLQDTTVAGLSGIVSPDGYALYLADANYVISIAYNFGTKTEVSFKSTFEMMLGTFAYSAQSATTKPETAGSANTNAVIAPSTNNGGTTAAPTTPTTTTPTTTNTTTNTNTSTNTSTQGRGAGNSNTNTTNTTVRTIQ